MIFFTSKDLTPVARSKMNSFKAKHQARLTNGRFVSPFESLGDQFDRYARRSVKPYTPKRKSTGINLSIHCKRCGKDPYDCMCDLDPASKAKENELMNKYARLMAKANPLVPPKPAAIEKNPLVTFDYPKSDAPWQIWHRCVRLISADATHYTGLEQTPKGWKYKKFLTSKARHLKVVSFNTMAMS